VVEREQHALHHVEGAVIDDDVVVDTAQMLDQSLDVRAMVVDAGHASVPPDVVEPVGIELARDQRVPPVVLVAPCLVDVLGQSLAAPVGARLEQGVDLRVSLGEEADGHGFVVEALLELAKDVLDRVGEGAVAQVVEQRGEDGVLAHLDRDLDPGIALDGVDHLRCGPRDPDGVREAGVLGAREDQVRDAVLSDVPQPLEGGNVDELANQCSESIQGPLDVTMDRVTEDLRPSSERVVHGRE
jgi:hypothetical protein